MTFPVQYFTYFEVAVVSFNNGTVSTKIYDTRDDFDYVVYFLFLDGDVPLLPVYGVYIYQLIRFARA